MIKGAFKKSDNKGKINDLMINDIDIKNPLSKNMNNILKNKDNDFTQNLSKTIKSSNVSKGLNNKYIYKSKGEI